MPTPTSLSARAVHWAAHPGWVLLLPRAARATTLVAASAFALTAASQTPALERTAVRYGASALILLAGAALVHIALAALALLHARYACGDDVLVATRGVLTQREERVPLALLVDVEVVLPWWQRLAGCGTVTVVSHDQSAPRLTLAAIPDPHAVADMLLAAAIAARRRQQIAMLQRV